MLECVELNLYIQGSVIFVCDFSGILFTYSPSIIKNILFISYHRNQQTIH